MGRVELGRQLLTELRLAGTASKLNVEFILGLAPRSTLPLPPLDSTAIQIFASETGSVELEPLSDDDAKQKFECIWFDAHKVLEAKLAEAFSKEDYSACTPLAEAVGQVVAMKPDTFAETLADPTKAALADSMVDQLTTINPTASAVDFRTLFLRRASAVGAKKPRLH